MRLIFLSGIFLTTFLFVINLSAQNELHSPQNIKLFADYLFCEKDYLRAAEEYQKLDGDYLNDTITYKIALSYSTIQDFDKAKKSFDKIGSKSLFHELSSLQLMKIKFLLNDKIELKQAANFDSSTANNSMKQSAMKLTVLSNLKLTPDFLNEAKFLSNFEDSEKAAAKYLFDLRTNPTYKSSLTAGILASIIPGAGKFYVEEIGDGVMALLTTGIFAFLSYDNFNADHKFRGWLFAGISSLFYAGNIYGSVAAAQIYNSQVDYEFNFTLNSFLDENNFFIPQITFCK